MPARDRTASTRSAREAEFDALYTRSPDPWAMETSAYERAKYDATLAALPPGRFACGLEIGCSIGVLTERLAGRCERLTAFDVSTLALDRARRRVPDVRFVRAEVPRDWLAVAGDGPFDLVVVSEVLYFLDAAEVAALARLIARDLAPGGTVLAVNWTGENDRPLDGDAAAELFGREAARHGLACTHSRREALYRLEVYRAL